MPSAKQFVQQVVAKVLHCRKCEQPLKPGEDRYCKTCVKERQAYHGSWK